MGSLDPSHEDLVGARSPVETPYGFCQNRRKNCEPKSSNFRGNFRGLPKVVARFVREMIYGIQARQSVRLTEVSRALAEPISIKKTVEPAVAAVGESAAVERG